MKKFYPQIRSVQIKTGIWTIVITMMLVLGYLWLTNRLAMGASYDLKIAFSDVMGLEVGDKVMFRGMEVGRIKSIKAGDEAILCTARILSEISLKEGSRFLISDSSLMGGKALMISQGDGPGIIKSSQVQTGSSPDGIMNVISKASETLSELNQAILLLQAPDGLLERSGKLLNTADTVVQNTGAMAKELKLELSQTIKQVDGLSASLQAVVQENSAPLKDSIARSPALLAKIDSTLDSLQYLSANLNQTAHALNSDSGTAGMLLSDKQLYERLNSSVENLELLIKDIKANPKKYVKFSIF